MEEGREADVTWRSGRVRNGSLEPSGLFSRLPNSRKDFDLAGRDPGFSSGTPIKKLPWGWEVRCDHLRLGYPLQRRVSMKSWAPPSACDQVRVQEFPGSVFAVFLKIYLNMWDVGVLKGGGKGFGRRGSRQGESRIHSLRSSLSLRVGRGKKLFLSLRPCNHRQISRYLQASWSQ